MNKKNLLLTSMIAIIAYIVYLKVVGLSNIDYAVLFKSIQPLIPHVLAVIGAFVFNLIAYLKGGKLNIVWAGVCCALAAISNMPESYLMFIPLGLNIFAYIKA
jgi:hypothetical protein